MIYKQEKKPKQMVLLKDGLDYIFKTFNPKFDSTGKKILRKFAKDEKEIDYNDLIFEIDDPVIKSFNFLKWSWYIVWFID